MIEKDSGSEDGKNSSERASESTAATDLDWHPDDLDPEEVLAETSLIIASNRERNYTADSAPDWIETVVRTDEGRNVARNRGIEAASGEWIVVADDDITFPTQLTATLVHCVDRRHVVGLEDFPPMEWILTRYVIFHRSTWETIDGFDGRRDHGGDTDFAIRAEKAGRDVLRLPRGIVPHHDEDTAFNDDEHAEWLWYLFRRHPLRITPKAIRMLGGRIAQAVNLR